MTENEKEPLDRRGLTRPLLGALSGALAGFTALAVAELVSVAVRPQAGPVVAVGSAAIDRTPAAVKDWAIRRFGTDDKLVLQLGILAVLALFALGLGIAALRFRRTGAAGVLLLGAVGAVAATGRPDSAGVADALPSAVGAAAGAVLLHALTGRLAPREHGTPDGAVRPEADWDRRGFVVAATAAAAASAGAGLFGRTLNASRGQDAVAYRDRLALPRPASPAAAVPRGAGLRIPGVSPFTTPNGGFYRVDTALVVPKVDAAGWRLRVHGRGVTRPRTLSFGDLLRRELIERDITLTCVSNEIGGPYVGNARWIGVRLAEVLAECGVRPPSKGGPADQLVARSVDGMTIGSPVEDLMDGRDALLALGMNGQPLPFEHGFPVRMVVPGLYGFVSACKWIKDIELTTFDSYDPYWVKRGWARDAPIKTQSRIDTPKPFARPKAGTVMVAGVAWAQHRGIDKVEVRIDDGPWQQARLAAEDTRDTWRQWSFPWQAARGGHTLTVRATDRTGRVQTEKRTRTVPDGASGWHSVVVTVD
ncbi:MULTISPECIES: molybdopterin-dependent oxidoreductase [Streptomyces]|uniref:molybdopterin-dependent oxidoreductase n=1 Tax=Streptomyces TaxID=1883 RepID=UPI0002E69576|nr:molybdopterin-dependent oxidoreductase [Streptomyces scabiei]KFG06290.1 molybdopterin-binding oxidoreductase [Streptomyces scabiei]MDX2538256.1 molybdopterin-dependent oxidoreductase [Streptomyces scabiei]MDX2578129.1 molybdopterin-dependent oxidoreductase [Streptomyces scabiei]MDX2657456.1 molybdopterin-dependent oxidoreductase [Streptomyces scabiei]MDX2723340.1 molybdopterin-dependent oxidoreductase [Streptomyces scabiei]